MITLCHVLKIFSEDWGYSSVPYLPGKRDVLRWIPVTPHNYLQWHLEISTLQSVGGYYYAATERQKIVAHFIEHVPCVFLLISATLEIRDF